jgi:prepilin signal peptidase PulO-like enzyme (type II secretory pathway)
MMIYIYSLVFVFGLMIGSFLNCFIWRLHKNEGMWNRSYCPKCRQKIAWYDNIPLFSYLILRGCCRHCHKPISCQYPIVEFLTGVLFLFSFWLNMQLLGDSYYLDYKFLVLILRDWFIISVMTIIFIYDLRWFLILDRVSLTSSLIIFGMNLYLGFSWQDLVISGIIGSSFFLFQFIVSRGTWIGGGDIRLGLLIGVSLAWPNSILAIFLAYMLGSVVGIALILGKKKGMKSEVPLGTFLAVSTIITLFWGDKIITWYLNFL